MAAAPKDRARIQEWLEVAFPDGKVEVFTNFERDVTVFRVACGRPPRKPSLEISDEAFADVPADTIIADLEAAGVLDTMRRDETLRRSYFRDRSVPEFERRSIRCDGRSYRVVRDTEHNVRIYDEIDELLRNLPAAVLALPVSIHARSQEQWIHDIREWRGDGQ